MKNLLPITRIMYISCPYGQLIVFFLSVQNSRLVGGTPNSTILFQRHNDLTTHFLFIPHSHLLVLLFFITNVAVSLGWLRGK